MSETMEGAGVARKQTVAILGTRGYPSFYGGFETAVRLLAPSLADKHWDVTVYSRTGAVQPAHPGTDDRVKVKFTLGLETKVLSTLSYGLSSAISASRSGCDVALVMNVANGFWLPILRHAGIPTLVNVDGIEWDRAKWGKFAKTLFKLGARFTARYADELVFDAEAIRARWKKDFGRDGVVIPYGGLARETDPPPFGLVRGTYALMVARLVPENSVSLFFEAVAAIAPKWRVVIVGSTGYGGPLDSEAKRLQDGTPNVLWLGHVSNDELLHSLWANAGAYFHGHTVGGTNPALVQAMALGAPVVAIDTVYNREVLGGELQVCEPSATDIARKISELLENEHLRDQLSIINRERASSVYSWDRVNAAYERSLRELAGRGVRRRGSEPQP